MKYYNTETQTAVSERQVVKANPNTSFALPFSDATLASLGLCRLANDPHPDHDEDTQVVVDGPIEIRDGVAYQTYNVIEMSDKKKAIVAQRKKDAILSTILQRRYDAEVNGVMTNEDTGIMLDTSRETRSILDSVISWIESQTAITTVPWKHLDGSFEDLDANQLKAMRQIIAVHVGDCFEKERKLRDALETGTYTEDMLQEAFPVEMPEDILI